MNVVSIMAHQDDEMRCLGTMLKCKARGDRLFFITLTDGCNGFVQNPTIARSDAARIRHDEMAALAKAVEGTYINIAEEDGFLIDTPQVRRKLVEAIRSTQADLIFTHYHEDYNRDHVVTSHLVHHCLVHASLTVAPSASKSLKAVPAVFTVLPQGIADFQPTHFVDVSQHWRDKVRLLQMHKSQDEAIGQGLGSSLERLCALPDAYWGALAGCEYAECFLPMRSRGTIKPFNVLP